MPPNPLIRVAVTILAVALITTAIVGGDGSTSTRGWMGVTLGGDRAAPGSGGVTVTGVVVDGPAERAGLRATDRILAVDGAPVRSPGQFASRILHHGPGSWIPLTVERRGREYELRVRLANRPDRESTRRIREGWIGVDTINLTKGLRAHFGAPEAGGVMISTIEAGGPAEAAGFRLGDVVYAVEGAPIRSRGEMADRVRRSGVGNPLEVTLARDGAEIILEAIVARKPSDEGPGEPPPK